MSRLSQPNGDDYPDAAHKHLLDAGALLAQRRPDGGAYLSGYVVECALKALFTFETGKPLMHHDLANLVSQVQTVAGVAGARSAKYFAAKVCGVPTSRIRGWAPDMRHRSPSMTLADAQAWYDEALDVFQETVHQMRLDGVL